MITLSQESCSALLFQLCACQIPISLTCNTPALVWHLLRQLHTHWVKVNDVVSTGHNQHDLPSHADHDQCTQHHSLAPSGCEAALASATQVLIIMTTSTSQGNV